MDKAVELTEESRLIRTKDARRAEVNEYRVLANKIVTDADALSGSEHAEYFREAARSSIAEAAEISEEQDDIASYHTMTAQSISIVLQKHPRLFLTGMKRFLHIKRVCHCLKV